MGAEISNKQLHCVGKQGGSDSERPGTRAARSAGPRMSIKLWPASGQMLSFNIHTRDVIFTDKDNCGNRERKELFGRDFWSVLLTARISI